MNSRNALIIDDDIEIANLMGMVLSLTGFECDIAQSPKEALTRLATSNPDLVLLDLKLGSSLGGEDILYQIRANPRLKNTRVVVITGHPTKAEEVTPLVDFTLTKPIDIEQLKSIIAGLDKSKPEAKEDYFRDPVSGLYNVDFFHNRLDHAIHRAKRRENFIFAVSVIRFRLDQSMDGKPVDPAVFNYILREVAQSLKQNFRPTDTIARLSYYKFATLHEELRNSEDIKIILRRIQTILTPSFRIDDRDYKLSFQIGKATSKHFHNKADDLLELAEKNIEIKR